MAREAHQRLTSTLVVLMLLGFALLGSSPAAAAGEATVSVTPDTGLADRQQGAVTASGFVPGETAAAPTGFDPTQRPDVRITVTPDSALRDIQMVTVRGTGFAIDEGVTVVQCPAGAEGERCSNTVDRVIGTDQSGAFTMTVLERRSLDGVDTAVDASGTVDCAAAPGRCVMAAIDSDTGAVATTPLDFDPLLEPAPPTATVAPSTGLVDGEPVYVTADGFPSNTYLWVLLCRAGGNDGSTCDASFGHVVNLDADVLGHAALSYEVRRVIDLPNGTVDCASAPGACTLTVSWVSDTAIVSAHVPLEFVSSSPPGEAADRGSGATTRTELVRTGYDPSTSAMIGLSLLLAGCVALVAARRAHEC